MKEEIFWLHSVGTVLNIDLDIVQFLDAPVGSRFERDENGQFIEIIE